MLNEQIYEAFYESANEIFDEEVFSGQHGQELLDIYNSRPDDDARDMLFSIIDEMIESVTENYVERMRDVVRKHKDEFVRELMDE